MKISVVLNVDTRPGSEEEKTVFTGMNDGCRNFDFLWEGLLNKIKFFDGYDIETILYIDKHLPITGDVLEALHRVELLELRLHDLRGEQRLHLKKDRRSGYNAQRQHHRRRDEQESRERVARALQQDRRFDRLPQKLGVQELAEQLAQLIRK